MKRLDRIINNEKNIGLDFIVHIQNKEELSELIDVLVRNNFEIQIALQYYPNELKKWMDDIGNEENYDTCFRIRNRKDDKCVAHNPSVEHWRLFCNDIFEVRDGELEWNEGEYTLERAKIEAEKLWKDLKENIGCQLFDLPSEPSKEDKIKKIEELVGWNRKDLDLKYQ